MASDIIASPLPTLHQILDSLLWRIRLLNDIVDLAAAEIVDHQPADINQYYNHNPKRQPRFGSIGLWGWWRIHSLYPLC